MSAAGTHDAPDVGRDGAAGSSAAFTFRCRVTRAEGRAALRYGAGFHLLLIAVLLVALFASAATDDSTGVSPLRAAVTGGWLFALATWLRLHVAPVLIWRRSEPDLADASYRLSARGVVIESTGTSALETMSWRRVHGVTRWQRRRLYLVRARPGTLPRLYPIPFAALDGTGQADALAGYVATHSRWRRPISV